MTKSPQGRFLLLYFASAASYTSKESETIEAPVPLSSLFNILDKKYIGFRKRILDSCLITINLEYVDIPDIEKGDSEIFIKEGDEVAIIPPVSSGWNEIWPVELSWTIDMEASFEPDYQGFCSVLMAEEECAAIIWSSNYPKWVPFTHPYFSSKQWSAFWLSIRPLINYSNCPTSPPVFLIIPPNFPPSILPCLPARSKPATCFHPNGHEAYHNEGWPNCY